MAVETDRWQKMHLPPEVNEILAACPRVVAPSTTREMIDLACGGAGSDRFEVAYDVPGRGRVVEATVARVRNGIAANYPEPYMRRRDPDCMVIADELPTDKKLFRNRYGRDFARIRAETFAWLKTQELAIFPFISGREKMGVDTLIVAPANAGFFAFGLALLQGNIAPADLPSDFAPRAVIYVAPPFRHTYFDGKQVVVHNRGTVHELFAYNLYPGPSAKKGVYGLLISLGELEGWVTAHCSVVQVVTPYDNITTIMHEGASGGGKSEMLEQAHRERDGRLLLGRNIVTEEERHVVIPRTCELRPVTDDMALCHPSLQNPEEKKLTVVDAEDAWFVRVNHINAYGVDLELERLTALPPEPLLFLNVDAVPGSRALIWEHIEDSPGKPCPNPRVVIPRRIVPNIVNEPVAVDIRSIGVRTPPCTRASPSYGIIGLFHLLPPALAWLWRLVAPRGYANPSIVATEGMSSEGVGSYWPFATGRRVDQANLLLRQVESTTGVRYILTPNQHIGAWEVGFMPQWIAREYLARRGNAKFKPDQIEPARCPLLGHALYSIQVEGGTIPRWFLQVDTQPEVGEAAYDAGAEILYAFFRKQLAKFQTADLLPLARTIIECCLSNGTVDDYAKLIPSD